LQALEHVLVEQQAELTEELEALKVIRDQNGNHVIQKIIELVPRQHLDFIMDTIRGQVSSLASHAYGCRVIQRMLEHGTEEDKAEIMNELHSSTHLLITDQYGNYVAQHVIQNGKPEDSARIIDLVMGDFVTLSKHKFASNVVEKCIEHDVAGQRSTVCQQLTTAGSDGTLPLQQLMRDQYGNYVIRKYISISLTPL
jgi:mRNA-binding protein PUF3